VKQQNRGWLTLVGLFVVITLGWSLVLAAVLAGATVALAGGESSQTQTQEDAANYAAAGQTFSGVITDAHCGARHTAFAQGASECARMCVRSGVKYVIANSDKSYLAAGNLEQFDNLAGQRVTVVGRLDGDTINVISVNP
jgi:hypothetical protein